VSFGRVDDRRRSLPLQVTQKYGDPKGDKRPPWESNLALCPVLLAEPSESLCGHCHVPSREGLGPSWRKISRRVGVSLKTVFAAAQGGSKDNPSYIETTENPKIRGLRVERALAVYGSNQLALEPFTPAAETQLGNLDCRAFSCVARKPKKRYKPIRR
jgi:hypothetical protein